MDEVRKRRELGSREWERRALVEQAIGERMRELLYRARRDRPPLQAVACRVGKLLERSLNIFKNRPRSGRGRGRCYNTDVR